MQWLCFHDPRKGCQFTAIAWFNLQFSFYTLVEVKDEKKKKNKQKKGINLHCKKVSCTVSSLQLYIEWEQQSQMVNKCSFEGALHKTRFMLSRAVSSLCCRWFENQLLTNTLVANMTSFIDLWCNATRGIVSVFVLLHFSLCLWLSTCQIILLIDQYGLEKLIHGLLIENRTASILQHHCP